MKYIVEHSNNRIASYDTVKHFIDASSEDLYSEFEDHKEASDVAAKGKAKYAESHPDLINNAQQVLDEDVEPKIDKSPFKFFLDGSRHVYKTNEMVISGNVYPVVTGQIVVGCCKRENRIMSMHAIKRSVVLAVPQQFDYDNQGDNFLKKKCSEINDALKERDGDSALFFDRIITYDTDGDIESGRNKYLHQAIAVVQNEMMDQERIMVAELCSNTHNILNNKSWLVKDGTLEYKKEFTNRPDEDLDIAKFKHKLKNVIGVSKMFDPELLCNCEPKIGRIIAELGPHCRTNAYKFKHQGKNYCIWYVRLRDTFNRATRYSDVIKVEFILPDESVVDSSLIDNISAHLINEAYPVCYGKDARWGNHIYPVYLTESMCKAKYMNEDKIIKMI